MPLTIQDIQLARTRITPYIIQTPLLRLQNLDAYLGCKVYAKAECMQVTGAYKLRGAMNKILMMTEKELSCGVLAASSGNHGRALAYVAKMLGIKAAIVMPDTSPEIKSNAIRALGAEVVFCETSERFRVAERLQKETGAVMIPPFNDDNIMAGQGTVGLEILEQCPQLNTVIVPVSGGGLIGGVSTAIKALSPSTKVYGAEPAVLPKYSRSLEAGEPVTVPQQTTIADALVAQIPGKICFPYVQANTDGFAAVEEEYILKGMKLLLTEGKLLAEPSSCIGIGAVLQGLIPVKETDEVCFVISGGNVGLEQLKMLEKIIV
ncbi:MAG: threonine/serine dehydratase [Lacrimispora sp.]|uniref:threonine ammonia-lyase n=1 Tax=Lacrimispora sp. TaxID=2719234 RepID=UPI0039E3B5E5